MQGNGLLIHVGHRLSELYAMHRGDGLLSMSVTGVSDMLLFLPTALFHLSTHRADSQRRLKVDQFTFQTNARYIAPCHDLRMDQSRCQTLCQFKGHAAVVVRTVPVAHLWRIQRLSVLCEILEPTAMRLIYKMRFYVSPVFQGNIEERLVARQLPCVDTTDDGLTQPMMASHCGHHANLRFIPSGDFS